MCWTLKKKLDCRLRVQARSRGGRWRWTLKLAQKRSRAGRWSWAQKVGLLFCFKLLLNGGATDIVLVTVPSTAVETAVAWYTSCCAMARGHRLDTSIVLAAVHGLFGLPGRCVRSSLHSPAPPLLRPPPPPSPSLISHSLLWT